MQLLPRNAQRNDRLIRSEAWTLRKVDGGAIDLLIPQSVFVLAILPIDVFTENPNRQPLCEDSGYSKSDEGKEAFGSL